MSQESEQATTRFERAFNHMDDEIQAHTRAIGDWLAGLVEDAPVLEAHREVLMQRLEDLQGNADFKFPIFAYAQKGDIMPSWDRYNHIRAYIGDHIDDPSAPDFEDVAHRYQTFPVEIPFEIYLVTNHQRHKNIWTHLLVNFFWKRPSLRVTLPHWNLKVWAPFEITGVAFEERVDPNSTQMIIGTCMCRLKSYLRERVDVRKVHKINAEYKDGETQESVGDQFIDKDGDMGNPSNNLVEEEGH